MNIAARAGRWSAAHWKAATFGWLAFVVVAVIAGNAIGSVKLTRSEQDTGSSARAQAILDRAGFHDHAGESVLIQSRTRVVSDPAFRSEVQAVLARLRTLPQVQGLRSPLLDSGQISKDGHSALVEFEMRGSSDSASDRVQPVLNAVAGLQRAAPAFTVAEFGDASAGRELSKTVNSGLQRAGELSLPITFLILLVAFGAFVAAGLPVLLAFSAVLGSGGLAAAASHLIHASEATSSVMLLMGMAVGVDYSLFYLKREREERRAGHSEATALERAAATSGRAVLASGITVLIAMAGMLLAGSKVFESIGIGAMLVVFTAMVGSLTVLPALLGRLGDKVEKGHVRSRRDTSRVWDLVLRPVLRFPAPAAMLCAGVLAVMALPVLGLHTTLVGLGDLPRSIPIVAAYDKTERAFPGAQTPAQVVFRAANVESPAARASIGRLERLALASGQAREPIQTSVNAGHTVARIQVPLVGTGVDRVSMNALEVLRSRVLPASIGRVPGSEYAVTGETAGTRDFNSLTKSHFPLVFAFVLGLAFVLLLVTFRSLVIPLTSIVLNLLSMAAAYGVLVWVFQDGHLQGLLGFHSNGAIVTWLPLFLFAVLFGLSTDYQVFIVSRIKELRDAGLSTSEAVDRGIRTTAGTVSAAATVMVAVFAIFASLPTLDIKQLGVGLAVAVLLDATLIRGVLLPATMKMFGEWNWYLPRWLGWLPRVRAEAARRPATEAAA